MDGPLDGTVERVVARALATDDAPERAGDHDETTVDADEPADRAGASGETDANPRPAILDLRAATSADAPAALREWLTESRPRFSVSATFDPANPREYLSECAHGEAFDLLCHVSETTPARPLDG